MGSKRDRARAYRVIGAAVHQMGLGDPELGRLRWIGEGLAKRAFAAEVDPGVEGWPRVLVALVPRDRLPGGGARVEREARLLGVLRERQLTFRLPGIAVVVRDEGEAVLVCEAVEGLPLELCAGRVPSQEPWRFVAEVAAEIHRISTEGLEWVPGFATRRAHGQSLVEDLSGLESARDDGPRRALGWLEEHLPAEEEAVLLHGDLLGQNLRDSPGKPPGVIDWESAERGDPAYDLAVVTRGVRRPFQLADGMARLLAAYRDSSTGAGAAPVGEPEVRFHEIALHLRCYRQAVEGVPEVEPKDAVLERLRNLLRRG